jgi:hypothetical protein
VNEAAGRAENLPKGALTIRLKQSMLSALRDGLAVALAGVDLLGMEMAEKRRKEKEEEEDGEDEDPGPPRGCGSRGESQWTSELGMELYK